MVTFLPQETFPQVSLPAHLSISGLEKAVVWGAWVAQSVKPPPLDFSSGHDLTVREFESHIGLC